MQAEELKDEFGARRQEFFAGSFIITSIEHGDIVPIRDHLTGILVDLPFFREFFRAAKKMAGVEVVPECISPECELSPWLTKHIMAFDRLFESRFLRVKGRMDQTANQMKTQRRTEYLLKQRSPRLSTMLGTNSYACIEPAILAQCFLQGSFRSVFMSGDMIFYRRSQTQCVSIGSRHCFVAFKDKAQWYFYDPSYPIHLEDETYPGIFKAEKAPDWEKMRRRASFVRAVSVFCQDEMLLFGVNDRRFKNLK